MRILFKYALGAYFCVAFVVAAISISYSLLNKHEGTPQQKDAFTAGLTLLATYAYAPCLDDSYCTPHGVCDLSTGYCDCSSPWISLYPDDSHGDGYNACNYSARSQLTAFCLSFFLGILGVDWFYLARGNAGYIVAGIFKLLTIGGLLIWWGTDWIRILCNYFGDGNGYQLYEDM